MKVFLLFVALLSAVAGLGQSAKMVEIEGHRGARGHVPENTIPSFIKAIELGASTIELDLAVSADGKLVVSHEPWFSHVISLDPNGNPIAADKEKEFNIYTMKYSEIKLFDVGSLGNKGFPDQIKMKVVKPLLSEVIKAVDKYARQNKLKPVRFNIEIKSGRDWDEKFTPAPDVFAKMVHDAIVKHKLRDRVIVQSFDVRPLQELRKLPVRLPIAILVGSKESVERSFERLGFTPDTYSPHFMLLDENAIRFCREKNVKIVPWTVNEVSDLERMRKLDIDGIITDYPDRARKVFAN